MKVRRGAERAGGRDHAPAYVLTAPVPLEPGKSRPA